MYNPFHLFGMQVLEAFTTTGHRFFVRQYLHRAADPSHIDVKGYYLISHYTTLANAKQHYDILPEDKHRFLYEWDNPTHREKLIAAASVPAGYRIYTSLFQIDWRERITKHHKEQLRRYLKEKLGWSPSGIDALIPEIFLQFGELFITINWGNKKAKIKFDDIEKMK